MNRKTLAQYLDHTLLRADATPSEVRTLVEEALKWDCYAVCVNSGYVPTAVEARRSANLRIAATVGFPLGQMLPLAKARETAYAIEAGADEIDMVWNLGLYLSGQFQQVADDIAAVVREAGVTPVKVILETARLTPTQIQEGCRLAVSAGAKMVKTSTGFGYDGASLTAIRLMRQTVGPEIGVKASGGIASYDDAMAMIDAGASRIGLSKTQKVLDEAPDT